MQSSKKRQKLRAIGRWREWHNFCGKNLSILILWRWTMAVLHALSILEAAILECKQKDIYTPEVREALDFLQPRIRPEWLIPQFRYHAQLNDKNEVDVDIEAQQHALRRIFPRIRESVKDPLGKKRCGYTY